MHKWLPRASIYGATTIVTFAIWLAFLFIQDWLITPCLNDPCQTFASYEAHDPFCIIDPLCASPFYKDTLPSIPHWQGVLMFDGLGAYGDGLHVLAIPNYIAFMAVEIALVVAATRYLRRPLAEFLALISIYAWCSYSVLLWFGYISSIDPTTPWLNPETVVGLLGSLSLLGLAARVAGRARER